MNHRKSRTLQIGSYSSGTMREEDLIPAFLSAAEDLRLTKEDRATINAIQKRAEGEEYFDSEDAPDDCSDLFDLLDRYTPDYTYFGAHPGDGADYGVWIVEDLMHDTTQGSYDGYAHRSDNLPGEDVQETREAVQAGRTHWLHVNDHGNCTLYRRAGRRWVEVWSV
jgi:hypothetical protein